MKVAIVGSRGLRVSHLENYLPPDVTEIVSGGARGIDAAARDYAQKAGIPLVEYLPDYRRYGRAAPLRRNLLIVQHCDLLLAFWDGKSRGTRCVVDCCKRMGVPFRLFRAKGETVEG